MTYYITYLKDIQGSNYLGIKVPNDEVAVKTIQDMVSLLDKLIQEQKK